MAATTNVNVLSHVPSQLQRLVRLVVRAFYQPEHYIVMDILARYPCVTEADLLQLLKLDSKKLRVILSYLKKDKLIKSVSRMEPVKELENGEKKSILSNYYYINYKVFVNVVKYKLDRMRERIQTEERTVSNRTSYLCPNCQNTYSDLDVDRLLDPMEGILRCYMCRSQLEEDTASGNNIDARSILSKLNEQLRPILDLLREMENISLAEHILDPEPQSIQNIIEENKFGNNDRSQQSKGNNWTTNKIEDIYGDQTFTINIGSESDLKQKAAHKVAPQWMKESTVYESTTGNEGDEKGERTGSNDTVSAVSRTVMPGDEIMKLLASEEERHKRKRTREEEEDDDTSSGGGDGSDTSSEEEEEEEGEGERRREGGDNKSKNISMSFQTSEPSLSISSNDSEEEDEDDDELTLKVGDKVYELADITPDVIALMTPDEKERYTELYQQAYSNYF